MSASVVIDLDRLQAHRKPFDGQLSVADTDKLFAIVEALRKRNANLKRVADVKPEDLNQEFLDENEALRKCVRELEGVLEDLLRWHRNEGDDTDEPPGKFLQRAAAVLVKAQEIAP